MTHFKMADKEDEREPLLQSDVETLGPPPQYTPHPVGRYNAACPKYLIGQAE